MAPDRGRTGTTGSVCDCPPPLFVGQIANLSLKPLRQIGNPSYGRTGAAGSDRRQRLRLPGPVGPCTVQTALPVAVPRPSPTAPFPAGAAIQVHRMSLPSWFWETFTLSLKLTPLQGFGLAFLLGSFAVATLSDLKRLSAQREFLEVWLAFLAVAAGYGCFESWGGGVVWQLPAVKWALVALFSLLSFKEVGVLFKLAPGDVAALAAAASLLTPVLVIVFYLAAWLIAQGVRPLLARGKAEWAFMPVVSLATIAVLVV